VNNTPTSAHPPPRIISWNLTLRCPLKCRHCYIGAGTDEAEGVLSTKEAFSVIDQIRETGRPILVLSGGEPLMRDDIFDIAKYGTDRGLRIVMGSSGYLLDESAARNLNTAGVKAVAISIDSADPSVHDEFRGVGGSWERAVQAVQYCRNEGIGVQINTSVRSPDPADLEGVLGLGTKNGVRDYQIFFPVPTGRARENPGDMLEYENLIRQILLRYRDSGLNIRPTCAPQFRRIAHEAGIVKPAWGRGCLAGISYCRIYATGEVTPCPYLPVSAGNLRDITFRELWNSSPIFTALRDLDRLTGKCGNCGYKDMCGGCRARAYRGEEMPGARWCDGLEPPRTTDESFLSEDPWCPYQPGSDVP
jgi:AdoMet-dependent heme synthase